MATYRPAMDPIPTVAPTVSRNVASAPPSERVILERAQSLANEAVFTVELQRRRLRSIEPEDDRFAMRWWADAQLLIVTLRRLRRVAELASRGPQARGPMRSALRTFDACLPALRTMRDVCEHIDAYAIDRGHRSDITRGMLQVGQWDGTSFSWLGASLDVDVAMRAAVELLQAIRGCSKLEP